MRSATQEAGGTRGGAPPERPAPRRWLPLEERLILNLTALLALWSVLATLCTLSGLSFRTLSWVFSAALPIALILLNRSSFGSIEVPEDACGGSRDDRDAAAGSWHAARWILLALCALGAAVALLEHLPNHDDGYYFGGRTIYFLAHPEAALDLDHHHHAFLDWPLHYPLTLLQAISLFWAYLGYVFGLSGLDVLHYVAPVLGGFFMPLAWYLALSRFVRPPLAVVVGATAIIAVLCLDGLTDRSFGQFAFRSARLGKGQLIGIYLPVFIAYSRDWFSRGGLENGAKLFLTSVACAGLSDSSLFLLPVLITFMAAGALASLGPSRSTLKKLLGYFACPVYLYAIGLYMIAVMDRSNLDQLGFQYDWLPSTFSGQFAFVFGDWPSPFALLYLVAVLASWSGLRGRGQRAFLAGWTIAAVLLINPWLFQPVARNLTSYNGYWRLFFLCPCLLSVGLAPASLLARLPRLRPLGAAAISAGLVALTLTLNLIPLGSGWTVYGKVPFRLTGYKFDQEMLQDVELLLASARPGPMIAPLKYSQVIPLFTHEHPQIAVRSFMLEHIAALNGKPELAESRLNAVRFLAGRRRGAAELEALLDELPELENVVAKVPGAGRKKLQRILEERGFRSVVRGNGFLLFVRLAAEQTRRTRWRK